MTLSRIMILEKIKPDGIIENNMDINLILLTPNSMMLGFQYYDEEEEFNFFELNIFLLFFQVQFRWGENL